MICHCSPITRGRTENNVKQQGHLEQHDMANQGSITVLIFSYFCIFGLLQRLYT